MILFIRLISAKVIIFLCLTIASEIQLGAVLALTDPFWPLMTSEWKEPEVKFSMTGKAEFNDKLTYALSELLSPYSSKMWSIYSIRGLVRLIKLPLRWGRAKHFWYDQIGQIVDVENAAQIATHNEHAKSGL